MRPRVMLASMPANHQSWRLPPRRIAGEARPETIHPMFGFQGQSEKSYTTQTIDTAIALLVGQSEVYERPKAL